MSVNGIQNNTSDYYQTISSGHKVNQAADGAAGLSIVEKMTGQISGYEMGTQNAETGRDLLQIADAGLSSIADSLQRIRDLSVRAGNGTYSQDERDIIQNEINQLKQSIQDAAKGTEFNTLKLLDGSMADIHLATNPSGEGMSIQLQNSTLEALGIEDYDVSSGVFDIRVIDKALAKVAESRSSVGSATNALESNIRNNYYTAENLTSSRSRIQDEDVAKAISELKKNQAIEEYQLYMQKERQNQEQNWMKRMFT